MNLVPFYKRSDDVGSIIAHVERAGLNELRVFYQLTSKKPLRLKNPGGPIRQMRLWEHTCFELFLGNSSTEYLEFNFSPFNKWQCLSFKNYRDGAAEFSLVQSCRIRSKVSNHAIYISINIYFDKVVNLDNYNRIALSAVALDNYWALSHAGTEPDFHASESRTLQF